MDKLIEELTYFAYDGERDFFDITRSEAKSFLNELGKKDDEIERLNNIINELEKYLNKVIETSTEQEKITCSFVLQYLQELKGSDK